MFVDSVCEESAGGQQRPYQSERKCQADVVVFDARINWPEMVFLVLLDLQECARLSKLLFSVAVVGLKEDKDDVPEGGSEWTEIILDDVNLKIVKLFTNTLNLATPFTVLIFVLCELYRFVH